MLCVVSVWFGGERVARTVALISFCSSKTLNMDYDAVSFFLSETQLNRASPAEECERVRAFRSDVRLHCAVHPFAGANDLEMINKETVPVP